MYPGYTISSKVLISIIQGVSRSINYRFLENLRQFTNSLGPKFSTVYTLQYVDHDLLVFCFHQIKLNNYK